jgi:hypothetical protein
MKKCEFGGVKTHDWHTLIKLINNFSIHIYILVVYIFLVFSFFCLLLKQVNDLFFFIVCSMFISHK